MLRMWLDRNSWPQSLTGTGTAKLATVDAVTCTLVTAEIQEQNIVSAVLKFFS